jgi:plasmid stabilization system protein ParE
VSESRCLVRPKANSDLDEQAFYYGTAGSPEVRIWDGTHISGIRICVFRVNGFEKMLILYRPLVGGVEILRVVHGSRNLEALLRRDGLE